MILTHADLEKWKQVVPDASRLHGETCTDFCEYGGTFDLTALVERKNGQLLNVSGCWNGEYFESESAQIIEGWELWRCYANLNCIL